MLVGGLWLLLAPLWAAGQESSLTNPTKRAYKDELVRLMTPAPGPAGSFIAISKTILVRGNVRRIVGMQSLIAGVESPDSPKVEPRALSPREAAAASVEGDDADLPDAGEPKDADKAAPESAPAPTITASFPGFRIADGASDTVVFEDFIASYGSRINRWFDHASERTLVVRRCSLGGCYNTVPGGKVFFEDNVICNVLFDRRKVWMRQWNPEAKGRGRYNCINKGSDLWILGLKTEGPKIVITTVEGGRTEVLGGDVYPNRGTEGNPAFVCEDGQQSLSYSQDNGWISPNALYEEQVREIRSGRVSSLWRGDVPKRGGPSQKAGGLFVPLYVGYTAKEASEVHKSQPEEPRTVYPAKPAAESKLTPEQLKAPQAFYRGGLGRTGCYDTKPLVQPKSGAEPAAKWKVETQKDAGIPVVADGVVYFGDRGATIYKQ